MTASDAPDPTTPSDATVDPVLVRRAHWSRMVTLGQRIGYSLFGLFMVLIIIGFVTHFPSAITTAATVCLVLGSLVLAPAMTFSYAVKAAEREDRDGDWR